MSPYATTEFHITSMGGFSGPEWFVSYWDGEEDHYLNIDLGTTGPYSLIMTDHMTGTKSCWIPMAGTVWVDTGWALEGDRGDDIIQGWAMSDWLKGSDVNDSLTGLGGRDKLEGGLGKDTLYGGDDEDLLDGGNGDDRLNGGAGDDKLVGGLGNDGYHLDSQSNDTIEEAVNGGIDSVSVNMAEYTLRANLENATAHASINYTVRLTGNELANTLTGSLGADNLKGGAAGEVLNGGGGKDWMYGGTGNDSLYGGDGNDTAHGGDGNDQICGDGGADLLYGAAGADRFVFASATESTVTSYDRVMDFVRGTDKIDLSLIDADSTPAGNQAFSFAGAKPFFASAGDLYFKSALIGSVVEGDVNGKSYARKLVTV